MQITDKVKIYSKDGKCKETTALFDTGSKSTYISDKIGDEITYYKLPEPREITLATKDKKAEVIGGDIYTIEISKCKMPEMVGINVVKNLNYDIIIGTDVIEKFDIELDIQEGKPRLKKCPPELSLV